MFRHSDHALGCLVQIRTRFDFGSGSRYRISLRARHAMSGTHIAYVAAYHAMSALRDIRYSQSVWWYQHIVLRHVAVSPPQRPLQVSAYASLHDVRYRHSIWCIRLSYVYYAMSGTGLGYRATDITYGAENCTGWRSEAR
eukprot:1617310-Rhodomonas_salina.3